MRFLFLFLLIPCICQAQAVLSKRITITGKKATVGIFLNELNTIPGISLSYSSGVIDLTKKIELNGVEKTVEDFLISILKGQKVKYIEQNGKIFLVVDGSLPKKKFTLSGYIVDKKTGERLIGASVYLPFKKTGTTSNNYGFFSITLEEDTIELQTSYAGYLARQQELYLHEDRSLNIEMEQNVVISEMVIVNSEGKSGAQNRTVIGKTIVPVNLIKSVPALLGEADVLKTLQLLPGVQAGNEGTAGLYVRGGSPDQNLILLDGVPVYNASHAFGMFSIFNADAVHYAELLKSGFPASYGGRVSSIIDVHMKEGDKYNFHGEGGLGLIFSKFTFEGPIKKGQSSFLVSSRRTYADLLLRPLIKSVDSDVDLVPYFMDVNVKANFPLGKMDRIYFSIYTGLDKLKVTERFGSLLPDSSTKNSTFNYGFSWGNITSLVRWNHVFNKKMFANFTFNYSRYRFNTNQEEQSNNKNQPYTYQRVQKYFSGIHDFNVKADLDYLPTLGHFVKAGFAATLHRYRPGINYIFQKDSVTRINETIDNLSLYTGEYDAYVEDDIRLSQKSKINVGMRISAFAVKNKTFYAWQPRVSWLYKLGGKWSLKAAGGIMYQYIHLLTNSNLGLPTDLWLPATEKVPPQSSKQISIGTSYSHDKSLDLSVEVYYKALNNVIEYSEGAGFGNIYNRWEDIVESGKGKTYGMEWLLQKRKGKITGLAGYTLSRSLRQFQNINDGRTFPFKYDRRHEIKLAAIWQPSPKFEVGADWIFSSGQAISMPLGYYFDPFTGRYIDIYESRNNFRMPDYHRLDVSVKFIKQKKRYLRTWILSVYNAYHRFNPFFRYKEYDYFNNKIVFKEVSVFPIVPSISYQFKF